MRTTGWLLAFGSIGAIVMAAPIAATADAACNFVQRAPSSEELVDCLAGPPRVRGIRRVENGDTAAADPAERQATLMVTFEFDSSELTSEARRYLDALGEALRADPLRETRFVIEGHTDAVGSAEYNVALSERRAESVYRYLYENFGVDPDRMRRVGRGFQDLYDPSDPQAPVNRRVRIVNLGDG